MRQITKLTDGYVKQLFELDKEGNQRCVGQAFIAVDTFEYLDENGHTIYLDDGAVDFILDLYYPFDMIQLESIEL